MSIPGGRSRGGTDARQSGRRGGNILEGWTGMGIHGKGMRGWGRVSVRVGEWLCGVSAWICGGTEGERAASEQTLATRQHSVGVIEQVVLNQDGTYLVRTKATCTQLYCVAPLPCILSCEKRPHMCTHTHTHTHILLTLPTPSRPLLHHVEGDKITDRPERKRHPIHRPDDLQPPHAGATRGLRHDLHGLHEER